MQKYSIYKQGAGLNGSDLMLNLCANSRIHRQTTCDLKQAQLIINSLNNETDGHYVMKWSK